jgi:hypothetical protein
MHRAEVDVQTLSKLPRIGSTCGTLVTNSVHIYKDLLQAKPLNIVLRQARRQPPFDGAAELAP